MLKNFDYKVPKSENCVLININNWLKPKGRLLAIQKISGRNSTTYITEALKTNITEKLSDKIKEGRVKREERRVSFAMYTLFTLNFSLLTLNFSLYEAPHTTPYYCSVAVVSYVQSMDSHAPRLLEHDDPIGRHTAHDGPAH